MGEATAVHGSRPAPDRRIPTASSAVLEALRLENRATAARMRACYDLLFVCDEVELQRAVDAGFQPEVAGPQEYAVIDPFDIACNEIVARYGVAVQRARSLIRLALSLIDDFPDVFAAMERGLIDEHLAKLLVDQMRTVDPSRRGEVQRAVMHWLCDELESGRRPGRNRIASMTDRLIEEFDPDGVLNRRRTAIRERTVSFRRGRDGMAHLNAYLTSAEAAAVYGTLHQASRDEIREEKQARGEPTPLLDAGVYDNASGRTIGQRRADVLVEAVLGPLHGPWPTSGAGEPDPGASGRVGGARITRFRPHITVLAPLGPDGEPAVYLPRGGPATIDALIELLRRCVGATLSVPDPAPGAADSPHAARRYRISDELARRVRLRDGTCRHPGCSVPADDCDVDHAIAFNHQDPAAGGLTTEANLMCLCRQHHRFKTFHDWRYRLSPDGTLTIITSTGHTLTTVPDGPLEQWRRRRATAGDHAPPEDQSPDEAGPSAHNPPRSWLTPDARPTFWLTRIHSQTAARRANIRSKIEPEPGDPDYHPPPF